MCDDVCVVCTDVSTDGRTRATWEPGEHRAVGVMGLGGWQTSNHEPERKPDQVKAYSKLCTVHSPLNTDTEHRLASRVS